MLKIRWLGQSGYILTDGRNTICIDPYLSDIVNQIANRPRTREVPILPQDLNCDAVICTHNHLDHIDIDSIPLMNKSINFFAPGDCEKVLNELGVAKYNKFDEGTSYIIGAFKITAVFADHTVPAIGLIVEYNGEKLYFSGDTFYNEKLKNLECDYMFICINGKLGNMNVDEAIKLTGEINPKLAIPNHYDMFESNSENPENFKVKNRFIMEFNREYEVIDGCLI